MTKLEEMTNPNSCWNKAKDNERVFVLLERDPAMPAAIRAWITERLRIGKNISLDAQIQEANQLSILLLK